MVKAQGKITLIQLYKYASEEFKLRLLQFLIIHFQKIVFHINGDMSL